MSVACSALRMLALLLLLATTVPVGAQGFEFTPPAGVDDPGVPALMRDLAERMLPVYQEKDQQRYLANLAALQLVAGNPVAAGETRRSLQDRRKAAGMGSPPSYVLFHELVVHAREAEAAGRAAFADALTSAFRERVRQLGDREAHALTRLMAASPQATREALQSAFDRARARGSLDTDAAMTLVWDYLWFDAYRRVGATVPALVADENARRYTSEENRVVEFGRGIQIVLSVVRPRHADRPLPAILEFGIDPDRAQAFASAAHGYVGVVAWTRGKKHKDGRIIPFEHDGADAQRVIGWIAEQPWSDQRVAMFGEGYSGFAAWAALRRPPAALKAIATADAMAPGIDFPMEGRILRNAAYRWATEHTQGLVEPAGGRSDAQWRALDLEWYRSGRPYRDLDRIAGEPNRVFRRWVGHPSYDRYWQKMIPHGKQFANVDIPVLSISGYYAQGSIGALHYFAEHTRRAPTADHRLLLGPWDERAIEDRPARRLGGYEVDAPARLDLHELRFEWLDHVLGGGAMPKVLGNRVNYWMMGADTWYSAPSLEAMAGQRMRLYLQTSASQAPPRALMKAPSADNAFFRQHVDRADRSDPGPSVPPPVRSRDLDLRHAVKYVSEPLERPLEIGGLLSGQLDLRPNRMDVDLNVSLYEQLADGSYLLLFDPYEFRASYAQDRRHRHLLRAGVRQQLAFHVEQPMGRRLRAGSRVVLVLGVNQRADRQINYGLGDDVNAESLRRAGKSPLEIRWYPGSYIELPVAAATGAAKQQ